MNSPTKKSSNIRNLFVRHRPPRDAAKPFVIMYHGSLVERHGVDLAVTAVENLRSKIPGAELRIYGRSTPFLERVSDSVRKSELSDAVRYLGPMKLEQIPAAIRDVTSA